MLLVPYDRFELRVPGTVDEVAQSVRSATGKQTWFNRGLAGKRFVGSVGTDDFRLARVPRGRNTYAPLLVGTVRQDGTDHVVISVVATVHPGGAVSLLAMLAWCMYLSWQKPLAVVLMLLAFVILHIVLWIWGFVPDVKMAQVDLLSSLQKEPQA